MSINRKIIAALVGVAALVTTPGVAWGHGLHYIGTLTATGNATGAATVSAATGQGVAGQELQPGGTIVTRNAGCANSPTSSVWGPLDTTGNNGAFDQGENSGNQGCVDVHTTTPSGGFTTVDPVNQQVTISGSGFRPNTTFGVTYLDGNDPGDHDGDVEGAMVSDTNDPFCHREYFVARNTAAEPEVIHAFVTSNSSGVIASTAVQLGPDALLPGALCLTSDRFQYKGPTDPAGDFRPTSQGQSVPMSQLT